MQQQQQLQQHAQQFQQPLAQFGAQRKMQQQQQQSSATSLKATTSRMMDELVRIRKARQKTEQSMQRMKQDLEEQKQLGERKRQALIELQVIVYAESQAQLPKMRNEELSNQLLDSEGKRDLVTNQVSFNRSQI